jgi:hypothetical protein
MSQTPLPIFFRRRAQKLTKDRQLLCLLPLSSINNESNKWHTFQPLPSNLQAAKTPKKTTTHHRCGSAAAKATGKVQAFLRS